jgi:hypothetical protein
MLHEEVDAVLFGRDGEGCGLGDEVDDLDVRHVELEAGGGAGVGADSASDDDGGLLGEGLDAVEDLGWDGGTGDDALDGAGAVAEDGEEELAALAHVVEPAAEGDRLADVVGERGDGGDGWVCFGHGDADAVR